MTPLLDGGPPAAPTSQEGLRRLNTAALLHLLHVHGTTSRADLTALTGLNRSTVKGLTGHLVGAGLAVESAPVGNGGTGRPSIVVAPRPDAVHALAVDIGVEQLTAARVGLGGVVLDRRVLRQKPSDFGVRRTVNRVEKLLRALLRDTPPSSTCLGLGIGVCGVVSRADGVVRFAPNLGWTDVPLRESLSDRLGPGVGRISLGNDGDLYATAEHLRGVGRGCTDLVVVTGDVGIGGGIIVDGRLLHGAGGFAGEMGHLTIDPDGDRCRCGRRGCWETEISDEAVLRLTGAPAGMGYREVLAASAAGEKWVRPGMRRVGTSMGLGVVDLVHLLNPQLVVFGRVPGEVFRAVEPRVRAVLARGLVAPSEQVQLAVSALGDDGIVLGAAELAFEAVLADPLGALEQRVASS